MKTKPQSQSANSYKDDTNWTISNIITLARILLVPLFVAVMVCPWPEWINLPEIDMNMKRYIAAAIFILISGTDWLDGYLARSRNEVTTFGKFMDPLADKILVAAALLVLIELGSLPSWVALIILAREFIVSGVRMIAASEGVVIAASYIGKSKTVFQMVAIVMFTIKDTHMAGTAAETFSDAFWVVSWIVMIIALVLTIVSMMDYLVKARTLLGFGSKETTSDISKRSVGYGELGAAAKDLVEFSIAHNIKLATAESLTGGMISASLTSIPGSSEVVKGGVASYTNEIKRDVLNVDGSLLESQGAVCEDVAREMADGVAHALNADITVSVTGIAGPTGAEPGKPVGTVFIGCHSPQDTSIARFQFEGDREEVRRKTTLEALLIMKNAALQIQ